AVPTLRVDMLFEGRYLKIFLHVDRHGVDHRRAGSRQRLMNEFALHRVTSSWRKAAISESRQAVPVVSAHTSFVAGAHAQPQLRQLVVAAIHWCVLVRCPVAVLLLVPVPAPAPDSDPVIDHAPVVVA